MSDYLALDWDDQQLIGVSAHIAARNVRLTKTVRFDWAADERPSERAEQAGKRLRVELDRLGMGSPAVLVSLPREEAIVRLLELPECTDDELPEIFRFQAATRSSAPLDKLLLDYLPLPRRPGVPGRRVLMVTIGKSLADRIQSVLSGAGLQAARIGLSAIGAAEVVARQPGGSNGDSDAAIIVSPIGTRIEITATSQNKVLLMHAGNLSGHDAPETAIAQIVAETSRAAVALSQSAPGIRLTSGWVLGCPSEMSSLPPELKRRFGFDFASIATPFQTAGLQAEIDPQAAPGGLAFTAVGKLLAQAQRRIESIDFLHPRRQQKKPDRRRLRQALAAGGLLLALLAVFAGIQWESSRVASEIEKLTAENRDRQKTLESAAPFRDLAQSLEDWNRRDIDWIDQLRELEVAMGGSENHYITLFDGVVVVPKGKLASIKASGHAKSRDDVEELEQRLHDRGYAVTPKEIVDDSTDRQYPEKMDLSLDVPESFQKSPLLAKAATPAGPQTGTPQPADRSPPGKSQTDKPAAEKSPIAKPAAERPLTDKPATGKSPADATASSSAPNAVPAANSAQTAQTAPDASVRAEGRTIEAAPAAVAPAASDAPAK